MNKFILLTCCFFISSTALSMQEQAMAITQRQNLSRFIDLPYELQAEVIKIDIKNRLNNNCIETLEGHAGQITCLVNLQNNLIASGSQDNTIRIWDINTCHCIQVLEGHTNFITNLIDLQNGQILSTSKDNTTKIWDTSTGACKHTLKNYVPNNSENRYVRTAKSISLGNGQIALYCHDKTIRIWDSNTGEFTASLGGHEENIVSLINLNDDKIASISGVHIKIWDKTTSECLSTLQHNHYTSLEIMNLGDNLIASVILKCALAREYTPYHYEVKIWNILTSQCIKTLELNSYLMGGDFSNGLLYVGNGRVASTSSIKTEETAENHYPIIHTGGDIELINMFTNNIEYKMEHSLESIDNLVNLKNNKIVSVSNRYPRKSILKIWDTTSGECEKELFIKTESIEDLIELEDGRILIVESDNVDGSIKIIDQNKTRHASFIFKKYFTNPDTTINHPIIIRLCTLEEPLTEEELAKIKSLFTVSGQFDQSKFDDWISKIHPDLRDIVKTKLTSIYIS